MSSHTPPTSNRSGQQTLFDAAVSRDVRRFPKGVVLRHEPTNERLETFILGNTLITYVMINFSEAWDLVGEYGSLQKYLSPWQVPIICGAEEDEKVGNRTRWQIRRLLERAEPAIYIPDAGKVYFDKRAELEHQSEELVERQKEGLREYRMRVDWLLAEIQENGWEINLLPLAKAHRPWHLDIMMPWYEEHGFEDFAFYTRQYCNEGNNINLLRRNMGHFIDAADPRNIFVIARLGRTHLKSFSPRVTGASGIKQFYSKIDYNVDEFTAFKADIERNVLSVNTELEGI